MNDEQLKCQLGYNIATFRKRSGMTQAVLAEKINFSDKAVSKWERGESIPDILTVVELARLFDITVDDLLKDHNALPIPQPSEYREWIRPVPTWTPLYPRN